MTLPMTTKKGTDNEKATMTNDIKIMMMVISRVRLVVLLNMVVTIIRAGWWSSWT